jgi:hypothetical protein
MCLLEVITRVVLVVGIPVFADQSLNMARAMLEVYGLIIDFIITTQSFT